MEDWPENDFRVFVGNLGNEVTDEMLALTFRRYPSFSRAKVSILGSKPFWLRLVNRS